MIAAAPAATSVIDYGEQFCLPRFLRRSSALLHASASPYMLAYMDNQAHVQRTALVNMSRFSKDLPDDVWL